MNTKDSIILMLVAFVLGAIAFYNWSKRISFRILKTESGVNNVKEDVQSLEVNTDQTRLALACMIENQITQADSDQNRTPIGFKINNSKNGVEV